MLQRFTYTVSHDLKSPLITIRGFLGFLEEDATAGDAQRMESDIAYITAATEKMQRRLNELLELSRIGRLINPPEEIHFEEIVHEALETVSGRLNAHKVQIKIAAVILDLTIPGGMGGKDAVSMILSLDPTAAVIVSSGYSNDPVIAEYRHYGFRGAVCKPYRLQELSAILHEVLVEIPDQ